MAPDSPCNSLSRRRPVVTLDATGGTNFNPAYPIPYELKKGNEMNAPKAGPHLPTPPPALLAKPAQVRFPVPMFAYVTMAEDKPWQLGPYDGVELKILHKHGNTGGVVVLRKFKAGSIIPAHTHPDANEWAYVLSGDWEESGKTYGAGALFFAPKGLQHGPHTARCEVVSLTIFDGPLTVA
jgi:hypothetical protein